MPTQEPTTTNDKYTPTHWGSQSAYQDLVVPSGQRCLVKKPGVELLLKSGILHQGDMLSKLVQSEHVDRVKPKPGKKAKKADAVDDAAIFELLKDEKNVDGLMHTIDRIVCFSVVKPEVQMTPNDSTSRKEGVIYADMIDLNDRLFIMNYAVGGQQDLEPFREEPVGDVGGVDSQSEDASKAK